MVMMGIEFAGDIPFNDVYITSIIQAPDGRRMSKSLGTGIDPLDEIDEHGADAVRFGLLAMSSSQDVRYSAEKIRQGQQLANKMWNASRLVLTNAAAVEPAAQPQTVEDRWICSRLMRVSDEITEQIERYDFSHAVQTLYSFFWNEFCDWYLEMVKPRLYGADEQAKRAVSANLLFVLEQTLALAHPVRPVRPEEIWSFLPDRKADLVVSEFPVADPGLIDEEAEREIQTLIDAVRALRNYRESVGIQAGAKIPVRVAPEDDAARAIYERGAAIVASQARVSVTFDGDGADATASVSVPGGKIELLAADEVDPAEARRKREAKIAELRSEIKRAEGKLANEKFVAKAPPELVDGEREKLERYKGELAELES